MNYDTIIQIVTEAAFLLSAIIICASSMLYIAVRRKKYRKYHNRIFWFIMIDILISATCATINIAIWPYASMRVTLQVVQEINQFLYLILHSFLGPLYCFYIAHITSSIYTLNRHHRPFFESPVYIMLALILTNPLTHWVYHFSTEREIIYGWAYYLTHFISFGYIAMILAINIRNWRHFTRRNRRSIIYLTITYFLGILIQLLIPEIQFELFMESIAMVAVMITLENDDVRRDPRSGILNQTALVDDIRLYINTKQNFSIICVKMIHPQNLMQQLGPINIEKLTQMTSEYITSIAPRDELYYTNPGIYIILIREKTKEQNLHIANVIHNRFRREWNFLGSKTAFRASTFYADIPHDLQNAEQILSLILSPLPSNIEERNEVLTGKDLNFLMRRAQVERIISTGLERHAFEVHYQPIYDAKDRSICAGEALLRLHDPRVGDIHPYEFLPIAERNGLIFELGDFVLEEVCKFLNSGIPVEMGIETLNINLSTIQILQTSYAEHILQITSRYNISPEHINFEITESVATTDFATLSEFIRILQEHGFHFSVDDYGIGYSNVHSIFSLNVDTIKIDRSILWEAEKSEIGSIIMESTANMVKRMGFKILISGVETEAQVNLSKEFDVDYLQGFYFSNPVTQNEFISILKATKLARMEEQRAIAANEAMSNFLANMSHEIRTPINAILGMDEMILRVSKNDRILEYAKIIEGAGRTLISLINDILDFSKIESGSMQIVETDYQLSNVLNDVVNMIEVKAQQKQLRLLTDIDTNTPENLHGDETRIRQIMLNILNNAVKYTNKGTVSLQISYEALPEHAMNLVITIRDTGIGIKKDDLEKLFKKFQRLDTNRNRTIEGSGLGLAIVHQLLDLMGGQILVDSTYGKGSVFTVTIPQIIRNKETIGNFRERFSMNTTQIPKYQESFQAPTARILVVDDTPMNLVVVKELLKKTKIRVDEASSGMQCLQMVQEHYYDLILLDYRMPEFDGIETLHAFKRLPNNLNIDIPVIVLTANAISGAREHFIAEGFHDYITKPIDSHKLEGMMLKYLPKDKIRPNT